MARKPASPSSPRGGRPGRGPGQRNQVRIIGGTHRGRKLRFPDQPGLRPTADRVRETLFNWLQPLLPGAACLDLFAGSGGLGFEAASRGAARVIMLEKQTAVVECLRENLAQLGFERLSIEQADALQWLRGDAQPFDIVFVDPPFDADLYEICCRLLDEGGWLQAEGRVYLECPAGAAPPVVPETWRKLRAKRSGDVAYYLFSA